MSEKKPTSVDTAENLGRYLKSVRLGSRMTLRDVENATGREVSNGYLSQLESGKITKPSVHMLYALSASLGVPYETLMERAGYIMPAGDQIQSATPAKEATYSIDNLTVEEEKEMLDYLIYIRSKKR
jgi:transcriptional regulator with XRE-family HTH domain